MAAQTKKPPAKTTQSAKTAQSKAASRKRGSAQPLPVLLEVMFTFSGITVVVVGLIVAAVSVVAGCPIWIVALRAGGAVLVVGLLLWGATFILSRGSIQANHAMREILLDAMRDDPLSGTVERTA